MEERGEREWGGSTTDRSKERGAIFVFLLFIVLWFSSLLDLTFGLIFGLITFYMTTTIVWTFLMVLFCGQSREDSSPHRFLFVVLPLFITFCVCLTCKLSFQSEFLVKTIEDTTIDLSHAPITNEIFIISVSIVTIHIISALYQQFNLLNYGLSIYSAMVHYCEMICILPFTILLDIVFRLKADKSDSEKEVI